jgi:hypothetical protein
MVIHRLLLITGLLALAACSSVTDPDPPLRLTNCNTSLVDPSLPRYCKLPSKM